MLELTEIEILILKNLLRKAMHDEINNENIVDLRKIENYNNILKKL